MQASVSSPAKTSVVRRRLARLAQAIDRLYQRIRAEEQRCEDHLTSIPRRNRASACNLIHYLALRQQDLRGLQRDLAENGLSSLGRCEAHVLASVQRLRLALHALTGKPDLPADPPPPVDHSSGPKRLARQATALFGNARPTRAARIMVTLPGEAADDPVLIERLMAAGMDLARINCAHDDASTWLRLIRLVHQTASAHQRRCRIMMDLGGPKLRTGDVGQGEAVVAWSPERDHRGRVVRPARVAMTADGALPSQNVDAVVPLTADLARKASVGDWVVFYDARGKRRRMQVVHALDRVLIAESTSTAYLVAGITCQVERAGKRLQCAEVAELPATEEPLILSVGDHLLVTADQTPGSPARRDATGALIAPARVPCSLAEILGQVRVGERICFDDGRIEGIIRSADAQQLLVEITRARDGGAKLRSDKGINLPDSRLQLPCLTERDRQDLAFVRQHADLIGLSFVHAASDVHALIAELGANPAGIGVILKIETPQAFEQLPSILLAALGRVPMGVMVARGDLAVEIGFARLAEVQEEILWLCEAAHLPVIWGTQVLETLAKKGMATRAEVTDAAMSVRAECVMLNKGPHIVDAVTFLDDVLVRMQEHQAKKRSLLRRLAVTTSLAAPKPETHD